MDAEGMRRRNQESKSQTYTTQEDKGAQCEPGKLSFGALEQQFWDFDEKMAASMYSLFQNVRPLKVLGTLVSVSGDEAIWFVLPVLIASVLTFPFGGPLGLSCKKISCEMELLLDLFGGMALCATVEQFFKLFFQRPRPTCRKQNTKYFCVWGEWYSFPSGHTIRAFYIVNWLLHGAHPKMVLGLSRELETALIVWAVCVAVSRVAAGRHHPVDVVVGAMIGMALSYQVEMEMEDYERAMLKVVSGVSVAIQVWFLLLGPIIRDSMMAATESHRLSTVVVSLAALAYYSFYLSALYLILVRLPESDEECLFGRLSHILIDQTWHCKSW